MLDKPDCTDDFQGKTDDEVLAILFPDGPIPRTRDEIALALRRDRKDLEHLEAQIDCRLRRNLMPDALSGMSERVQPAFIKDINQMGKETLEFHQHLSGRQLMIGIDFIDKCTRGIGPGEVMMILARTKVGKTILGQNILRNMNYNKALSLFFSLEMTTPSIYGRWAQMEEGLGGDEFEYIFQKEPQEAAGIIAHMTEQMPYCKAIDKPRLTCRDMEDYITLAETWESYGKVRCVLIDYLGLVDLPGKTGSTYERVSLIAKSIAALAKEKQVAVIVIHQTSRVGGTGNARITFNMGRDSGVIEEAVDSVVTCWRPKTDGRNKITLRLDLNRKGEQNVEKTLNFNPRTLEITELPF